MAEVVNQYFVSIDQLSTFSTAFQTKADARFLKLSDAGSLATKSEVGTSDLATELENRIAALETTSNGLGALAVKDEVVESDLGSELAAKLNGKADTADLGTLAAKSEVAESDLASALASKIDGKADSADVYTKQETYTQTEVDNLVAAHISSAYKAAGSSAFASLPTPAFSLLGNVYNVTDSFSTTAANFVDYVAGNSFPAGTNVVVVEATPAVEADPENNIEAQAATYKYDVLQGWVDLSNYATVDTATTTANGIMSAADKAKLDGVVPATSAQVTALVNAIWPAPTPAEPEEP